jgi:hypothetical protein
MAKPYSKREMAKTAASRDDGNEPHQLQPAPKLRFTWNAAESIPSWGWASRPACGVAYASLDMMARPACITSKDFREAELALGAARESHRVFAPGCALRAALAFFRYQGFHLHRDLSDVIFVSGSRRVPPGNSRRNCW